MIRGLIRNAAPAAQNLQCRSKLVGRQQNRLMNVASGAEAKAETAGAAESAPRRKKILVKDKREIIQKLRAHNEEHDKKAKASGLEWRTVCATVLHRYPVITPEPEPWEVAYSKMDEELTEFKRAWMLKQITGTDADFIGEANPTYEEIIATLPFKPASRITEADKANDMRSTERRLSESSFLIVKRNREQNAWQFPQGKLLPEKDGESLRKGAERVIDRAVGNVNRWFISNAPIGHICYAYPPEMQKARGNYGAKVYFYRCQLIAGTVKLETRLYTDYAWVARDEVAKYTEDPITAEFLTAVLPY